MADLTPARIAELRATYFRAPTVDEIDRLRAESEELQRTWGAVAICNETLRKGVDRILAVIRETHIIYCSDAYTERGMHAPECRLYEIEP